MGRASRQVNALTRDTTLNVVQLLQATLSILENEQYCAKDSEAIANLKKCLPSAIAEIEAAISHKRLIFDIAREPFPLQRESPYRLR